MITSNRKDDVMFPRDEKWAISLADGQNWSISASITALPWLRRLKDILELESSETSGQHELIFVRNCFKEQLPLSPLASSTEGWAIQHLNPLQVFSREHLVICELGEEENFDLDVIRMWLALYPIFSQAQERGGLPMHAGLIERNGICVAIAAPGNTGKSTCCNRVPPPWKDLCDDEILVVHDKCGTYYAHPFPTWSEILFHGSNRTWNVQHHLPLAGIFFLRQSEHDGYRSISKGKAAVLIYESSLQRPYTTQYIQDPSELGSRRIKVFNNACEIAKSVPAFDLQATLNGKFWEQIEAAIGEFGAG